MSMMALDLRNQYRTVEQPKPWRSLIITITTAFAVAGILLLRQPSAEAADPVPVPPPPAAPVVEAPAPPPPPVAVVVAPPPAAVASTTPPAATPHKKKKHALPLSEDAQTRRALRELQRAQLNRATASP